MLVIAEAVDHLLFVQLKQPSFQTLPNLSAAGIQLPKHSIAQLQDTLGLTGILVRVSMKVLVLLIMHQLMVCLTLKALQQYRSNTTHYLQTIWVLLGSGPVVLILGRLAAMVHMIIALLQCPLTNLHHIHNSLLGAVGNNLGDFVRNLSFSFFGAAPFLSFVRDDINYFNWKS